MSFGAQTLMTANISGYTVLVDGWCTCAMVDAHAQSVRGSLPITTTLTAVRRPQKHGQEFRNFLG